MFFPAERLPLAAALRAYPPEEIWQATAAETRIGGAVVHRAE